MSLTIRNIRITNFLCFRGEHEHALGPGTFALIAEREGDPSRSNYQGKTSFLRAVRFALTGDHPHRTEDGWVTDGESSGGVDLELSDGTFVSRARTRGGSTKLELVVADGPDLERKLLDAVAQAELDRLVGFSSSEQLATWWVEQKGADAFINGEPGELTPIVAEWCGINPVRKAAGFVADELNALIAERNRHIAEHQAAKLQSDRVVEGYAKTLAELDVEAARWKGQLVELELQVTASKDAAAAEAQRKRAEANLAERTALGFRGHELEDQLAKKRIDPGELVGAKSAFEAAIAKDNEAVQVLRTKRLLATGKFSGICPVGGIECPATELLNSRADENRAALEVAEKKFVERSNITEIARARVRELEGIEREATSLEHQVKTTRERLERLRAEGEAMTPAAPGAPVDDQLVEKLRVARQSLEAIERDLEYARRQSAVAIAAAEKAERLEPRIAALREALLILGPAGAQRKLAEGFLTAAENGTTRFLSAAGIDVSVKFSWQRPLKDPADHCLACGQPFPSSRKVKVCLSCGQERGPKIEQKLRCLTEPKSVGGDDLAGLACRFAVAAWLKARRGSSWAVACLDEPLAFVDVYGREGVARQLLSMLSSGYGFDQVFVSAHEASVLGAMPRRIRIVGTERGSRIEVT